MKVSYEKLWLLCVERKIGKAELRKRTGLSLATFTKLKKNQEVNLSVLLKIAEVMKCNAGDMMDFLPDDAMTEVGVDDENLIASIKLAFKTKNFFCRVFLVLWVGCCSLVPLVSIIRNVGSYSAADIFRYYFFYLNVSSPFLISAISIAQGKRAAATTSNCTRSNKSWGLTLVLSIFLGWLGAHRFYVGRNITGVIYFFSTGGYVIGWLTDVILILTGNFTDRDGNAIKRGSSVSMPTNRSVDM